MEKIAILSDVHGNITALESVISDIENRGISKIYCLGDSVIKCANPDKVIDLLCKKCHYSNIHFNSKISGRKWRRGRSGR